MVVPRSPRGRAGARTGRRWPEGGARNATNYLVPRNETQFKPRRPTSKRPRRPQGEADAAPTAPPRRTARHAVRRHTGAERRRDRRRRRAARRRTSQHMKSRFTYAVLSTTTWHDAHLIQLFHLPCARKQASHAPGWGFGGSDLFGVLARVPAPPRPRREAREGDKTTDRTTSRSRCAQCSTLAAPGARGAGGVKQAQPPYPSTPRTRYAGGRAGGRARGRAVRWRAARR